MKKTSIASTKTETPALDVGPILALHIEPNGFVGFARYPDPENPPLDKDGQPKTFEHLFSIRVDALRLMFPAFAAWLTHDSLFTVNAYHRAAPWDNRTTGLPDVWRGKKHLSKLTACYSDIDCGRPESDEPGADLDWRQAQHEAEDLADRGVIPQPSMMARSGRGVYLFWFLRDEKDPAKLQHAWTEKRQLYVKCNAALGERLRAHSLPADRIHDAARVLRVPGSIHRTSGRRVGYVVQYDQGGSGFVYTLRELAAFLKIPSPVSELPAATRALAKSPKTRVTKNPGSAPLRSKGYRALHAFRAADLITIESWRDGFIRRGKKYPDGSTSPGRRRILSMYAGFLRGAKATREETIKALQAMAGNMKPPYPSDPPADDPPIKTIVQAVYSDTPKRWKNKTLCKYFGVTDKVARELELKTIRSEAVAIEEYKARPLHKDVIEKRRDFARQYIQKHGKISSRQLANIYNQEGFIGANHQTANEDLNAIDYRTEKGHRKAGRLRKTYKGGK